jgi:hypothetical protein
MTQTIEDSLEILAGTAPRSVNIRIDTNDYKLLASLAQQVHRSIGLTDRQLDLAVKKIEKYRTGLAANAVDVDAVLAVKPLRIELREIDRTHTVKLETVEKKTHIIVRFPFSKKVASAWDTLKGRVSGSINEFKTHKELAYSEKNLYLTVNALKPLEFEFTPEIEELHECIESIANNPIAAVPYISMTNGKVTLENISKTCKEYISTLDDTNMLRFINQLKSCGIHHKNQEVIDAISANSPNSVVKDVLLGTDTRFRVKPEKHDIKDVFSTIDILGQWPVLVILDDEKYAYQQTREIYEALNTYVPNNEINVFFRLDNGQPDHEKFNQFVKDNSLNNYIDSNTKVVLITKTRIPKPLYKADWRPQTAIVYPSYDYGKMAAYLNDFATVYYYNDAVSVKHNRVKGIRQIVEL